MTTLILNTFKYIYKFANILTHVYNEIGESRIAEFRVYVYFLTCFLDINLRIVYLMVGCWRFKYLFHW